jgi:hypothetical protein
MRRLNAIRKFYRLSYVIFISFFLPSVSFAEKYDYIYPNHQSSSFSNYGGVGLIQMPSARMQPASSLAFSWADFDPYLRGSIVAYPFSWFEASYQYTDINNALYSNSPGFSGNQTYKDKSFDAKILLFEEKSIMPAIAVGARDLAGTGVFSSEYLVASKKFHNLDVSFGIGWGNMSQNNIGNPFSKISKSFESRTNLSGTKGGEFNTGYFFRGNAGLFGGIELFLPNMKGLRLKVEYDGNDYDLEGFPLGRSSFDLAFEPVKRQDSKVNFGFVYPINNNFHIKLSQIKGNTINFGFSIQASLGKKAPIFAKNDPHIKVKNAEILKKINQREQRYVYLTSLQQLGKRSLALQNAQITDGTLEVVYSQNKFKSFILATGRVAQVLDEIAPNYIDTFKISNINGGIGMHTVQISRQNFHNHKEEKLHKLVERTSEIKPYKYDPANYEFSPKSKLPAFLWKISPSIRSQIGGPDGFYFGDLRLALHAETIFNKRLTLVTAASAGIVDGFDGLKLASDSIIPHVRTEIVQYLKQSSTFGIHRVQLNYFMTPRDNLYAKLSAGIFEEMFGGYGGEVLYRPFDSNFGIGAELWRVKQRAYNQRFKFIDYETTTGHLNLFYKEPISKVIIALKGGRFLAEDSGINFDFSRRFKSGLRIGAFFSVTDISKAEFGEGSFDKGFYFYIPVDIFFQKYSKGTSGFGLKPLTRDGAAPLVHSHHLWGITEQAQRLNIDRDWDDLYD